METWEKVTTRSRVSIYRTNDPMETIAAIGLKLDQDDRHTHIWKKTLCPVTVLVDSQVSDRCPWATCFLFLFFDSVTKINSKFVHHHSATKIKHNYLTCQSHQMCLKCDVLYSLSWSRHHYEYYVV